MSKFYFRLSIIIATMLIFVFCLPVFGYTPICQMTIDYPDTIAWQESIRVDFTVDADSVYQDSALLAATNVVVEVVLINDSLSPVTETASLGNLVAGTQTEGFINIQPPVNFQGKLLARLIENDILVDEYSLIADLLGENKPLCLVGIRELSADPNLHILSWADSGEVTITAPLQFVNATFVETTFVMPPVCTSADLSVRFRDTLIVNQGEEELDETLRINMSIRYLGYDDDNDDDNNNNPRFNHDLDYMGLWGAKIRLFIYEDVPEGAAYEAEIYLDENGAASYEIADLPLSTFQVSARLIFEYHDDLIILTDLLNGEDHPPLRIFLGSQTINLANDNVLDYGWNDWDHDNENAKLFDTWNGLVQGFNFLYNFYEDEPRKLIVAWATYNYLDDDPIDEQLISIRSATPLQNCRYNASRVYGFFAHFLVVSGSYRNQVLINRTSVPDQMWAEILHQSDVFQIGFGCWFAEISSYFANREIPAKYKLEKLYNEPITWTVPGNIGGFFWDLTDDWTLSGEFYEDLSEERGGRFTNLNDFEDNGYVTGGGYGPDTYYDQIHIPIRNFLTTFSNYYNNTQRHLLTNMFYAILEDCIFDIEKHFVESNFFLNTGVVCFDPIDLEEQLVDLVIYGADDEVYYYLDNINCNIAPLGFFADLPGLNFTWESRGHWGGVGPAEDWTWRSSQLCGGMNMSIIRDTDIRLTVSTNYLPNDLSDNIIKEIDVFNASGEINLNNNHWEHNVVMTGNVNVPTGRTLVIEPNVIIAALDHNVLVVNGELDAVGDNNPNDENDTRILFTNNTFVNEGDASVKIRLTSNSSANSKVQYCRFDNNEDHALQIYKSLNNPVLADTFVNSSEIAIYAHGVSVDIRDCRFKNDEFLPVDPVWRFENNQQLPRGVHMRNCDDSKITGCSFDDVWMGVQAVNSDVDIIESVFITNLEDSQLMSYGIQLTSGSRGLIDRNLMQGYSRNIEVNGSWPNISRNYTNGCRGYSEHRGYCVQVSGQYGPILRGIGGNRGFNHFRSRSVYGYGLYYNTNNIPNMYDFYNTVRPNPGTNFAIRVNFERDPGANTIYNYSENYWGDEDPGPANFHEHGLSYANGMIFTNLNYFYNTRLEHYNAHNDLFLIDNDPLTREWHPPGEGYLWETDVDYDDPGPVDLPGHFFAFHEGIEDLREGRITDAVVNFQGVVEDATDTHIRVGSIARLFECQISDDQQQTDMSTFFEDLADTTADGNVRQAAQNMRAQIYAFDGDYTTAIAYYEGILDTCTILMDSIEAVIGAYDIWVQAASAVFAEDGEDIDLTSRLSGLSLGDPDYKPSSLWEALSKSQSLYELLDTGAPNSNITGSEQWGADIYLLKEDITISQNGSLQLSPGTELWGNGHKIHVYGELNAVGSENDPIKFVAADTNDFGVDIILYSGSSSNTDIEYCEFDRSEYAIDVQTDLNNPVDNCTFTNCEYGVYAAGSIPVQLDVLNCTFESDSEFVHHGVHLIYPIIGSSINNCDFNGAMHPIFASLGDLDVIDCYISNQDSVLTSTEVYGIKYEYCNGLIDHNTILDYPTGILLYDSDPMLTRNKIEGCFREGLWLVHDAFPEMCKGGLGAYNWLDENGADLGTPSQISIEGIIYPLLINGHNNIWQAENGYAIVSTSEPAGPVPMHFNYWGTSQPDIDDLFSPSTQDMLIAPWDMQEQIPVGGYRTQSVYTDSLFLSLEYMRNEEYAVAMRLLQGIVENDSSLSNRVGGISLLFKCWLETGDDSDDLIDFLEDIADSTVYTRITRGALHVVAQIQVEEGEYEEAIEYYEELIEDENTSFEDSVCAVIDAGVVYLRSIGAEEELDSEPDDQGIGRISSLKPESFAAHQKKSGELLAALRNSSYGSENEVVLPTVFKLHQNYPNPFNPVTAIKFDLSDKAHVKLVVHNILGQRVFNLIDRQMNAGFHHVTLDMNNMASGMYFYSIEAGKHIETRKMVLLK